MAAICDVFLTSLPRDVSENQIRSLFKTVGNVSKIKIIEDEKNKNYNLCFVGFESMDEAMEAVRLADKSTAFGDPIKACISKKFPDSYDSHQKPIISNNNVKIIIEKKNSSRNTNFNKDNCRSNEENVKPILLSNRGRGRGFQVKGEVTSMPSFTEKSIKLSDFTLKSRELIDIEIIDLPNVEYIYVRPLMDTKNSKVEISDLLLKVSNLRCVESPIIGNSYLGKWDDGLYYRAELIECHDNGSYKVTFVDEGTSGDVVSDIKHIPDGPLQQYPKQFKMISLGCKDSEELRKYIVNESFEKKVALFWLGEFRGGLPLVNLFLNDVEIIENFMSVNKTSIRDPFSLRFNDLPNHNSDANCSQAKLIKSLYKSITNFTIQIKEPVTFQCNKTKPLILPTTGDICIYEKRDLVENVIYMRCVVKRRQRFSFDIFLFDYGENLNNVSIDCLHSAEEYHILFAPFTIICELDKSIDYSEHSLLSAINDNDYMRFSIVRYKGSNRYLVSLCVVKNKDFQYSENTLKKYIGERNNVIVTHVVSPMNFYVQVDQPDVAQLLNHIQTKLNVSYKAANFTSLDSLKLSQAVVAPFSVEDGIGEYFRAIIIEIRQQSPHVHVLYIDFGNDSWIDFKQLLNVDEDIVVSPPLALHCGLNVDINKEAWAHAIDLFTNLVALTDDDSCNLIMEVISVDENKLLIDLISLVNGSMSIILNKSGTCFMKGGREGISKSLCSGDIDKSLEKQKDLNSSIIVTEDYAALFKKASDLERRIVILERKVLSR